MKKNLLLVFGGKSGEHEVSLRSAKNVYNAIDRRRYDVFLMGIDKAGNFKYLGKNLRDTQDFSEIIKGGSKCTITFGSSKPELIVIDGSRSITVAKLDVAFPVLHGTFGEDGTIQGIFEMANLPYVGGGVMASSVCMDKEICKRVLRDNQLPVVPFYVLFSYMTESMIEKTLREVVKEFGFPLFVKPANLGSSVGISKAKDMRQLREGVRVAFKYDEKIIIEKGITGREIECAVMGNERPEAATPGEVIPVNEFYDYEAKYIKEGSKTIVPARLDKRTVRLIREMSIRAYISCGLEGMARVDFFVTDKEIYINEINTIPGFTEISMFPMMWQAAGMKYNELIQRLIDLAFERHIRRGKLVRSY